MPVVLPRVAAQSAVRHIRCDSGSYQCPRTLEAIIGMDACVDVKFASLGGRSCVLDLWSACRSDMCSASPSALHASQDACLSERFETTTNYMSYLPHACSLLD